MGDAHTDFGPRTGAICPTPAVTYAAFGQTFFSTYCTSCHASTLTGAARIGAPEGYDFDTAAGVRLHVVEIDEVAASGPSATNATMPFAGPMPTLAERQSLGQLLACGVPD
jgi:cytochrome c5